MRINLGIRRRLAPLVGNDRRKMELLNGLLFSLPGTPVLYYGDEIGMGDNVFLGDRNGVRTPMQWSADRNAGFSRANPQRLILPIIIDPEYHYEAHQRRSAAEQSRTRCCGGRSGSSPCASGSRRSAAARSSSSRPRTTACWRSSASYDGRDAILVVANLSRYRPVRRARPRRSGRGCGPLELFGHTRVPADRRAALPADARAARVLLVLAGAAAAARRTKKRPPPTCPRC